MCKVLGLINVKHDCTYMYLLRILPFQSPLQPVANPAVLRQLGNDPFYGFFKDSSLRQFYLFMSFEYSGSAEPPFRKIGNRESGAGNSHTAIVTFASLLA